MKYLRHFYVTESGIVVDSKEKRFTREGMFYPDIQGLDVKFQFEQNDVAVMYSTCPYEVEIAHPGATELSEIQWFDEIEAIFETNKAKKVHQLFQYVSGIKKQVIDYWWHHSEITAAMSVKVNEAQAALIAATEGDARIVAPVLTLEADARNMTVKELATRIMAHHDGLLTAEAVVSGHRGLISDTIEAMTMDRTDLTTVSESLDALASFDYTQGFDVILSQMEL